MRLDDDFDFEEDIEDNEDRNGKTLPVSRPVLMAAIISIVLLMFLTGALIMKINAKHTAGKMDVSENTALNQTIESMEQQHAQQSEVAKSVDELISGSTLTADDLDIWDSPQKQQPEEESVSNGTIQVSPSPDSGQQETNEDPATDGLHTRIIHADGKEEWVDINPYLTRNSYNASGLVYQQPVMKYYENGIRISHLGADISKTQDYVDFAALKKAGVEYVMIRLGQRGYQTGEITLDEYFADNMLRAKAAGLSTGVYFFSQATTLEEAQEEAEFVIAQLDNYEVDYPVVFYMDYVPRETTRGESLEKMIRTNIAIRFMDLIKDAGYMPMLAGTKEWLIQKYSLGTLMGYDIWLLQQMDIPDYPYEYIMWQYTTEGHIDGISGNANLSICFVDFSLR